MNIINESGVPYVITGIGVDTLSPDDMEGMSYPDGYEIYGPDDLLIPPNSFSTGPSQAVGRPLRAGKAP